MKVASLKFMAKKEPFFYNIEIDKDGNVFHYNEKGLLHRLDGPAIETVSGDKFWYRNGLPYRVDGPAIEYADGGKTWYIDGEFIGDSKNGFTDADFERWKKEHGL